MTLQESRWWEGRLQELQQRLNYRFRDQTLLEEAMTHASYAHEQGLERWNQRLEFLGDAVLELIVSDQIFHQLPQAPEGELTQERAQLVCEAALAPWGRFLELDRALRVGRGLLGKVSPAVIADALEALIGALYLDGGLVAAWKLIQRRPELPRETAPIDGKSRLQILCQERGVMPIYSLCSQEGPAHAPRFQCSLDCCGHRFIGQGSSRKGAEQDAAEQALAQLFPQEGPQEGPLAEENPTE